jgi:8-oxo-dGTP pyrophosphatase MutT (NUDIX family)
MTNTAPGWLRELVRSAREVLPPVIARFAPAGASGRAAAVLLLFRTGVDGPEVLLIQRAATLRQHAGQPAFPGGAVDPTDDGPVDAALREATEEVGLDRTGVEVVGVLPDLYLSITDFLIAPVVGWWHTPGPVGVADPREVARVESVPIAELADPANRHYVRHPSGYLSLAFSVHGMTVWGFTAYLLDGLLTIGGWARDWDQTDVRDLPAGLPAPEAPRRTEDTIAPYEPEPSGTPTPVARPGAAARPGPAARSGPAARPGPAARGRTDPPGTVAG